MSNNRLVRATVIAVLASVGVSSPAPILAQPAPRVAFMGCYIYGDGGYAGPRAEIRLGRNIPQLSASWNDLISSIVCNPACSVDAYEHFNYGGARRRFQGQVSWVGDAWNDKISSLQVFCDDPNS